MKKLILIGGGNLANHENKQIHQYMLDCCKSAKPRVLYVGTASKNANVNNFINCMKDFDCEVSLFQNINDIDLCDIIYIGGGNTEYMIKEFEKIGLIEKLIDSLNDKIIVGMSAGAIFWFKKYYSDAYAYDSGKGFRNFRLIDGINYIDGYCCPHYNQNGKETFNDVVENQFALALEDNTAIAFDETNIDILKENKKVSIYFYNNGVLTFLDENNKEELLHDLLRGIRK